LAFEIIPELCIGCTACSKRCPVECITGETKRIHWIDPLACIDCGACGIVCPTEAILDGAGRPIPFLKKKSERPIAVIDEIFCSGCDFCTDICPFDCLEIVKDTTRPLSNSVVKMVNEENCVACRLCEDVCQKEAIFVVYPDGTPFAPEGRPDNDGSPTTPTR
jgi:Na+-translocating ferredoxin:NAD+ oxidoreductase subunit B